MKKCALIVIDVQKALDDPKYGKRSTPDFEQNLTRVLHYFRQNEGEIIHIAHDSVEENSLLRPGLPGNEFKEEAKPWGGENIFRKTTSGAFVETGLQKHLKDRRIDCLYVAGLTTDHCVSTTVREASDLQYEVFVIRDATAAHEKKAWCGRYEAELVHTSSLVALEGEFAQIISTKEVVFGEN